MSEYNQGYNQDYNNERYQGRYNRNHRGSRGYYQGNSGYNNRGSYYRQNNNQYYNHNNNIPNEDTTYHSNNINNSVNAPQGNQQYYHHRGYYSRYQTQSANRAGPNTAHVLHNSRHQPQSQSPLQQQQQQNTPAVNFQHKNKTPTPPQPQLTTPPTTTTSSHVSNSNGRVTTNFFTGSPFLYLTGLNNTTDHSQAKQIYETSDQLDKQLEANKFTLISTEMEVDLLVNQMSRDSLHVTTTQEKLDSLLLGS